MSGVFLSYSRGDRALADQVIRGLRSLGVDVWWDEDMPGVDWQEELARQIQELSAVVVLWTPLSLNSKNVRDEARLGQSTEKLVNVLAGVPAPPFPFDRTNGLPLDGWTGREPHGGWARLVATVQDRLVAKGVIKDGDLTQALAGRDRTLRDRRTAFAAAETAFTAAKSDEEAAALLSETAITNFHAAQAQLRHVTDIKASPALLRVAQSEFDSALSARETSDEARKTAAAALALASRAMTRARADLESLFETAALEPHVPEHMPEHMLEADHESPTEATAQAPSDSSRETRHGRGEHRGRSDAERAARLAQRISRYAERRAAMGAGRMHPAAAAEMARRSSGNAVAWIFGGCAVATIVIGLVVMVGISSLTQLVKTAISASPSKAVLSISPNGNVTIAPAPTNAVDAAKAALVGDPRVMSLAGQWAAPGVDCDENAMGLSVTPDAKLTVQMGARVASTAIRSVSADGSVIVAAPDGPWSYVVSGKSLTVTPAKGPKLAFTRCEE
ncbi:MAG TPA: toll/interleukin-1 receptor domain-containing protein [Caulobacteraceae bacterium]|jgi:hypothetical protein